MNYTDQELLDRLKENLLAERTALRLYWQQSNSVDDPEVAFLLRLVATTEAHHAELLVSCIKELGKATPAGISPEEKTILELMEGLKNDEDLLRLNMVLEEMAVNAYRQDARKCPYPTISKVLTEIMEDEANHARMFLEAIYRIKKEPSTGEDALSVFSMALDKGKKRLSRPWLEMAMSGIIGAIHVTFGAVAMSAAAGAVQHYVGSHLASLVGALFFPIGFVLLKLSQSELFTENFLIPVVPVLDREAPVSSLAKLWILTLLGNLVGALLFGALVYFGGKHALGTLPAHHLIELTAFKLSRPFRETFMSAVFAGAIITTMTWLVLATKNDVAKLIAIWCCIFVMAIGSFTHVVVSTSEVLLGAIYGAQVTVAGWFTRLFLPASMGNLVGGMFLIALLHYLQVLHAKKIETAYKERKKKAWEMVISKRLRL